MLTLATQASAQMAPMGGAGSPSEPTPSRTDAQLRTDIDEAAAKVKLVGVYDKFERTVNVTPKDAKLLPGLGITNRVQLVPRYKLDTDSVPGFRFDVEALLSGWYYLDGEIIFLAGDHRIVAHVVGEPERVVLNSIANMFAPKVGEAFTASIGMEDLRVLATATEVSLRLNGRSVIETTLRPEHLAQIRRMLRDAPIVAEQAMASARKQQ